MLLIWIWFFVFIVISGFFLVITFSSGEKKLSNEKKLYFHKIFKQYSANSDVKSKITDFDKLYHKILHEIWYKWTFGEILKQKPKEITNLNKIWEFHKMRNKLVHDFDIWEDIALKKISNEYEKEIKRLLQRVS